MEGSLKQKTFSGLIWNFLETFVLQGFGFIQGVILARLLMPSDYGLIAMTGIFFSVSYTLMDAGFTSALIRKKERKEIDYSTVYVTNLAISFVLCVVLCLCATWIADFYNEPLLQQIVYVNALLLFLWSFVSVQTARLSIQLEFKAKSIINVISTVITGICSIVLAYMDFGVWSLIYPNFLSIGIRFVLFWRYQKWLPKLAFSWGIYKEYFSYGSKLMLTNLLNEVYGNIYSLIIGKYYSSSQLGYYTKGKGYATLSSAVLGGVIYRVTFPVLSKIQDDNVSLKDVYRRMIRVTAYVVFPIAALLFVLARPFVLVLVTEKWEPCIPFLQVLCFAYMWNPIHSLNLNLLLIKGRSDLFMRLEIIKKIIGVVVLFVTIPMGLLVMCYGQVFIAVLFLIMNTYYTGKFIDVGFFRQMKDLVPTISYSVMMGTMVWGVNMFLPAGIVQLIICTMVGVFSYFFISQITKSMELFYLIDIVKQSLPGKLSFYRSSKHHKK